MSGLFDRGDMKFKVRQTLFPHRFTRVERGSYQDIPHSVIFYLRSVD